MIVGYSSGKKRTAVQKSLLYVEGQGHTVYMRPVYVAYSLYEQRSDKHQGSGEDDRGTKVGREGNSEDIWCKVAWCTQLSIQDL